MQLSKRLQAVADMVTCKGTVCDVGCDHGYVSIYLVQQKVCRRVLAMDVRPGPLARAKQHIAEHGLEAYIETRLSDGLSQVKQGEAQAMICAGMGGRLMQKILTQGQEITAGMQELILQPQSEIPLLRKFLKENGYHIAKENIIWEDGKYYPILKVTNNAADEAGRPEAFPEEVWEELADKYGPWLLKEKHPVLNRYLQDEQKKSREILHSLEAGTEGERIQNRICQIQKEREEMQKVLHYFEST